MKYDYGPVKKGLIPLAVVGVLIVAVAGYYFGPYLAAALLSAFG